MDAAALPNATVVGDDAELLDGVITADAVKLRIAAMGDDSDGVRLVVKAADPDTLKLDPDAVAVALMDAPAGPIIFVCIALKLEPSVLYGTTSAPRNAYDC